MLASIIEEADDSSLTFRHPYPFVSAERLADEVDCERQRSIRMEARKVGPAGGLVIALLLAVGVINAPMPSSVSAAVTDVDCNGVDDSVGLSLNEGETADCVVQVDNDEAAVRIQGEFDSPNLVTLTSPGLTDIAGPPTIVLTQLQGLDADNDPDPATVLFQFSCVSGFPGDVLVEQAGTQPFGFLRFPLRCLGVKLFTLTLETATHGIAAEFSLLDQDDNGLLSIDLLDPSTGTLNVVLTGVAGTLPDCPVSRNGPRHIEVNTDACDDDTVSEDLIVVVSWLPECPSEPVDVRIGAKRIGSDDLETVTCSPPGQPPVVPPPPKVPEITPPSTGDGGIH
jgi:hypothetical protein